MNGIALHLLIFFQRFQQNTDSYGRLGGKPDLLQILRQTDRQPRRGESQPFGHPGSQHQTDRHGFAVHDRTIFLDGVSEGMPQIQQTPLPLLESIPLHYGTLV